MRRTLKKTDGFDSVIIFIEVQFIEREAILLLKKNATASHLKISLKQIIYNSNNVISPYIYNL